MLGCKIVTFLLKDDHESNSWCTYLNYDFKYYFDDDNDDALKECEHLSCIIMAMQIMLPDNG
jgi:hypothetical protein